MAHHLPLGAHRALVRALAEVQRRRPGGATVTGHHNRNRIAPLGRPLAYLLGADSGQVRAKFRMPFETVEVVPRHWRREADVLRVVSARLGEVPRCLADFGTWSVHLYLEGRALADVIPKGPIGDANLEALAGFFARLAHVPCETLPDPPGDWPADGDSAGFLRRLARFTEQRVHLPNRPRFGRLFEAVGVPRDAMDRFLRSVPDLTRRPFTLLHTDVHRANVLLTQVGDEERVAVIDWELALYGDPLHDLATHLVRMDYEEPERERMTGLWAAAMRKAGRPEMTAGLDRDLRLYLDFEHAQSVYPDIMRAALALPARPQDAHFEAAADGVCRALRRAWRPLDLEGEPLDERAAAQALRRWHTEDRAKGAPGKRRRDEPRDSGRGGGRPPAGEADESAGPRQFSRGRGAARMAFRRPADGAARLDARESPERPELPELLGGRERHGC
ncbi:phosphotransferase [Streptomyces sp. NBC_00645]|uniref:phosphotransferase n=1 Tax=Streptomyces sp. NBC_00645 TaxID=2975795 RepID=UPI00324E94A0